MTSILEYMAYVDTWKMEIQTERLYKDNKHACISFCKLKLSMLIQKHALWCVQKTRQTASSLFDYHILMFQPRVCVSGK